jgi:hypothetical protein
MIKKEEDMFQNSSPETHKEMFAAFHCGEEHPWHLTDYLPGREYLHSMMHLCPVCGNEGLILDVQTNMEDGEAEPFSCGCDFCAFDGEESEIVGMFGLSEHVEQNGETARNCPQLVVIRYLVEIK